MQRRLLYVFADTNAKAAFKCTTKLASRSSHTFAVVLSLFCGWFVSSKEQSEV
jgi:hypothetical protein